MMVEETSDNVRLILGMQHKIRAQNVWYGPLEYLIKFYFCYGSKIIRYLWIKYTTSEAVIATDDANIQYLCNKFQIQLVELKKKLFH